MSRKNRREKYEPLDLTPADLVKAAPKRFIPRPGNDPRAIRAKHEREDLSRMEQQRNARVNGGIDWSICLVPGCGRALMIFGNAIHWDPAERDHNFRLPLCLDHLVVVAKQAQVERDDPLYMKAVAGLEERTAARAADRVAAAKKDHIARIDGHIYFVRLNGLIKVGWSREVDERLRAYGPDVEVLCIYRATRHDETNLHRQLRPVLARGREWYTDCDIIADFVAKAVAEHGAPKVFTNWTKPKQIVAGKRYH